MNRNRVRLRRKLRCNRYDHIGRRVKKITPEATYTCFYDGWLLVKEVVERSGDTRRCGVSPRHCGGAGSSTSLGEDAAGSRVSMEVYGAGSRGSMGCGVVHGFRELSSLEPGSEQIAVGIDSNF